MTKEDKITIANHNICIGGKKNDPKTATKMPHTQTHTLVY